ncbi:FG-GAP-like repeat-containing protein [Streptomyces avicenniae]|uniref:FG-GAP-like repeat-containing protein n=1 Tax=Streptomyces avicenniae TaxID=500153 RepID=UPI00167E5415|nr:FG-GAP-like repeat-containing protein [Streptomyces avicenniae]
MKRLRPPRVTPRRATAGVAALLAAAVTASLLVPDGSGGDTPRADDAPATTTEISAENSAREEARRTGERVEVVALRNATSTTFALPDGSFELTAHAAPIRAKVNGEWENINTDLAESDNGWTPVATSDPVHFSDGGSGVSGAAADSARSATVFTRNAVYSAAPADGRAVPAADTAYTDLVTFTSAGHELTVAWPGPLPEPVVSGPTALYRNVFDGVDLMLTARDSGFSHLLVVHSPEAAAGAPLADIPYRLTSPDLTFHLDPVTQVVTAHDPEGAEVAVSPTPYMWDSAGTPAVTEGPDPEPVEPAEPTAPPYTEEPGEAPGPDPEPDVPSDELDTDAPSPSDDPVEQAAFRADGAPSAEDVLALPNLAGPQPGTHAAVGRVTLAGQGSTSAELTVTPDEEWLTDEETVWPVFIDPSITGKTRNWTTTYEKYPDSSFYDGANYNTGTTEARVGWESTTGGLSRSFFRLGWTSSIRGADVTSASIRLKETYAWSCTPREMQVWLTGGISSSTTWNRQPAWREEIGAKSFAHGWNSSCPDAYVTFDARGVAQDAADGGWTDFTIGLRAENEGSAASWKKFSAEGEAAPKITLVYNRRPNVPTGLDMNPGPGCDNSAPYPSIGRRDLILSAAYADPDGDEGHLDFELWLTGDDPRDVGADVRLRSGQRGSATIPASQLVSGREYAWRVRSVDSTGSASAYAATGGVCRFVFDGRAPNPPLVTSQDFPEADADGTVWSVKKFGSSGAFTLTPDGDRDVTAYQYSFDSTGYGTSRTVAAGQPLTVTLSPPAAGPHILHVRAADSAGNVSSGTRYLFYVTPRDAADGPGDVNGDGTSDLFVITPSGNLGMYAASRGGDIHTSLKAAHLDGRPIQDIPGMAGYWRNPDGTPVPFTHGGDALPGDGVTDMFARLPDGQLYLFPGDGYGSFDVGLREAVRLPSGAPDPAAIVQMITGDYNLDERPDLFVRTTGGGVWLLSGYTGATFTAAHQISATAGNGLDLVSLADFNKDGAPDLLFRSHGSDRLWLRYGIRDGSRGSTVASLSSAGGSLNGTDTLYAEGWSETTMPITHIYAAPDVTGDGLPDIWSVAPDGSVRLYRGGASALGAGTVVVSAASGWRDGLLAFG